MERVLPLIVEITARHPARTDSLYRTRYSEQIELTRAAEWLELWPEAPEAADKKFSVGP